MSNSQIAIEGLLNYFHLGRQKTNGKYKGFKAMDRSWDTTFMHFKKTHPYGYQSNIDKNSKALFEDLLKLCEEKKIQLIFVNCPEYIEAQKFCHNRDSIMNIYRAWSLKYNIPYFDYSNDSICFDKANFYNSQHMNNIGVDKFNNILVKDLKGIILKKDR